MPTNSQTTGKINTYTEEQRTYMEWEWGWEGGGGSSVNRMKERKLDDVGINPTPPSSRRCDTSG